MKTIISYRRSIVAMVLVLPVLTGCSNLKKCVRSIPASRIAPSFFDAPRSSRKPIDYTLLRQEPPAEYRLGPEDVLGVYIEGVLGQPDEAPPIHYPQDPNLPPAMGFPIVVRKDATIALPLVPPIEVADLTLPEAEAKIRKAYTVDQKLLQPGQDRIIVTLIRLRTFDVLVIREDVGTPTQTAGRTYRPNEVILEPVKRGRTYSVALPAYQNDVLHALSESGGLPGADAKSEVVILRSATKATGQGGEYSHMEGIGGSVVQSLPMTVELLERLNDRESRDELLAEDSNVTRIPLQTESGAPPPELTPEDIILKDGDIVIVESRESEVFYTGGMLEGGQHPIPRDYDLDVLGAIAMAGGSIAGSAGGSGTIRGVNFGGSSIFPPTRATIIRTANGEQITIRVNLKEAILDPKERVLIQPNDFVLLENTCAEVFGNVILNNTGVNLGLNGPLWK